MVDVASLWFKTKHSKDKVGEVDKQFMFQVQERTIHKEANNNMISTLHRKKEYLSTTYHYNT